MDTRWIPAATAGFALGMLTFVGASYVLHCGFNMGPWPCQRNDKRRRSRSR